MSGSQTGPKFPESQNQTTQERRQKLADKLAPFNSVFAKNVKGVNQKLMKHNVPVSEAQVNYYIKTAEEVNGSDLFNSTAHAKMSIKWLTNKDEPATNQLLGAFGNFGACLFTAFDTTSEGKKFSNVGSGDDSMDARLLMGRSSSKPSSPNGGAQDSTALLFQVKKSPLFPK